MINISNILIIKINIEIVIKLNVKLMNKYYINFTFFILVIIEH